MSNFEEVDIYDENIKKTGKTKIRHKDKIEIGEYIIGVQAIIINSHNEILISQRSKNKSVYPLKWECNGGAIRKGEDEITGLIREIYEELGILLDKENAIYLKTVKKEKQFKVIYLFNMDIEIDDIKFVDSEAIEAKWVSIQEFVKMFNKEEIVPNVDFDENDFDKCLKLLREYI